MNDQKEAKTNDPTQCPNLAGCDFFQDRMKNMPAASALYKREYCLGDFTNCARYKVKKATGACPTDLFPNEQGRVETLIDVQ